MFKSALCAPPVINSLSPCDKHSFLCPAATTQTPNPLGQLLYNLKASYFKDGLYIHNLIHNNHLALTKLCMDRVASIRSDFSCGVARSATQT